MFYRSKLAAAFLIVSSLGGTGVLASSPPPSISIYNIDTEILHADILSIGKNQWITRALEKQGEAIYNSGVVFDISSLEDLNIGDPAQGKRRKKHKGQSEDAALNKSGGSGGGGSLVATRASVAPFRVINVNGGKLEISNAYPVSGLDDIVLSEGGLINFRDSEYGVRKVINRITVIDRGLLHFGGSMAIIDNIVYLNDLVIAEGGLLEFELWRDSDDNFLVRKSSKGLADALNKIKFGNGGKAGVRDYNADYWEVGTGAGFEKQLPLPEPATCGAAFSLSALGFVAWRRRGKRLSPVTS